MTPSRAKSLPGPTDPGSDRSDRSLGLGATVLALVCCALWGGTTVAIRYSVDDLPPVGTAGLRFTLGFMFLYLWCRWESAPLRIVPGQGRPIVAAGLLLFVQISLLHVGTQLTTASHAAVFINVHPIFVALFAHWALRGDVLTRRKVAGLVVAMAGVCVVVLSPHWLEATASETAAAASSTPALGGDTTADRVTLLGDLLVLASGVLLGVKTVYVKRVLAFVEPGKLLLWHELIGVVLFFATSFAVERLDEYHFTTPAMLGVLYQGFIVAGFCFAAWTTLLKHHRASHLAVFAFTTPLFGLSFAHALRGDRISGGLVVGGLAVAVGIYLVTVGNGNGRRRRAAVHAADSPSGG